MKINVHLCLGRSAGGGAADPRDLVCPNTPPPRLLSLRLPPTGHPPRLTAAGWAGERSRRRRRRRPSVTDERAPPPHGSSERALAAFNVPLQWRPAVARGGPAARGGVRSRGSGHQHCISRTRLRLPPPAVSGSHLLSPSVAVAAVDSLGVCSNLLPALPAASIGQPQHACDIARLRLLPLREGRGRWWPTSAR